MLTRKELLCVLFLFVFVTACSLPGTLPEETPPAAPEPQIVIDRVSVEVLDSGLKPSIQVQIAGHYTDSCTEINKEQNPIRQVFADGIFFLSISPVKIEGADCSLPGGDFQLGVGLLYDQLLAGEYIVDVHGVRRTFQLEGDVSIDWETFNRISALVRSQIEASYGVSTVDFVNVRQVTWGDGCLEIPQSGEGCTPGEVPGYLFIAGSGEQVWAYHTNLDGSLLLEDPDGPQASAAIHPEQGVWVSVLPEHYAVNVRYGPGQDYQVQGTLEADDHVQAVGISEDGEWLQVVFSNDPYPYTLTWLYAPLTDFQPEGIDLPLATSDALKAAEEGELSGSMQTWVADFIEGLRRQSGSAAGLDGAVLDQPLNLLLLLEDDQQVGGRITHNGLYYFSLEGGLHLLYAPQDAVIFDYCLAADRQLIYLVLFEPDGENSSSFSLHRLPLTGGEAEWVAELPDNLAAVQLSPDGSQLAIMRLSEEGSYELFKLGVDGQQMTIFYLPGSVRDFAWSPDGGQLALTIADETGSTDVYLVNADGSGLRAVFDRAGMDRLGGWSPDGRRLVFSHIDNGDQEIYLYDLFTRGLVNVSNYNFSDHDPSWSPDGRFIAYHSNRFDSVSADSLMLWDDQTDHSINISRGMLHKTTGLVSWSPGSRYLLAWAEAGGKTSFYVIDVLTQGVYLLFGDYLVETDSVTNLRWVEDLQPAGTSQSIGDYWLVPVSPDQVMPQGEAVSRQVLVTITEDMNVRAGPGIDYELVGELNANTRVEVIAKSWDGFWLKINYPRFGADEVWIFTELTDYDPEMPLPVVPGPVIDLSAEETATE